VQSGKEVLAPLKHEAALTSARFSPDGKHIVTTSTDRAARVWDAQTGKALTAPLSHERNVEDAQFSPNGAAIVTASTDQNARIWDWRRGKQLTDPLKHEGAVGAAQFSSDGKWIVTASQDNTARLWDAQTGRRLADPFTHLGVVTSAQFNPRRNQIVTSSADWTVKVWDLWPVETNTSMLLRMASAIAGQRLNDRGVLEPLAEDSSQVLEEIREQLGKSSVDDDWTVWARWFLADRSTRTISPFSKITVPEYIENRIKENTPASLDAAEQVALGSAELLGRIAKAREARKKP